MSAVHTGFRTFVAAVVLLAGSVIATAAPLPAPIGAKRWAVILAIDNYADSPRAVTRSVESEGRAIGELLRGAYGYDADKVLTLYGQQATSQGIARAISDLRERISRGDTVLIVISARFEMVSQGALIVPYDADIEKRWLSIPLADLQDALASANGGAPLLTFIESCTDSGQISEVSGRLLQQGSSSQTRGFEQVLGCGWRGRGDSASFLGAVRALLAAWQPPGTGATLGTPEIIARLQKEYGLQIQRRTHDPGGSSFAFQRQPSALDPAIEARVRNRSADLGLRLEALAELAKSIAGGLEAARGPAEQLMMQVAGDASEDPRVRVEAVRFLGSLKVSAAQALLRAQLRNEAAPESVRVAALASLGQVASAPDPALLAVVLESPSAVVARAAVEAASQLGGDEGQTVLLRWLRPDRQPAPLTAALRALQLTKAPTAAIVPGVITILESAADPTVRREAIRLLGNAGDSRALDSLIGISTNPKERNDLKQDATYAIGALMVGFDTLRPTAADALRKALNDQDAGVRRAAVDSLGRVKHASSRDVLERSLRDRAPLVREAAATALGQLGDRAAASAVVRALRDPDARVRWAAARALGEIGGVDDIPNLLELAYDSDPEVRLAVNQSLDRLKSSSRDFSIWSDIIQKTKDPAERARAIARLPEVEDPRLAALLIETLRDDDSRVRLAAILKTAALPGSDVMVRLNNAIGEDSDELNGGAAAVLGEIGRTAEAGSARWSEAYSILTRVSLKRESDLLAAVARALGGFVDRQTLDALGPFAEHEKARVRLAVADAYRALGEAFYSKRDFPGAIRAARTAVDLRVTLQGDSSPEVATDYNNLGVYLLANNDSAGAELMLRRALNLRENTKAGGNELDTAVSLTNLASVYEERGDLESAETLYLRALSVRERLLPLDHPLVVQSSERLVQLYNAAGDSGRATIYSTRPEQIRKK